MRAYRRKELLISDQQYKEVISEVNKMCGSTFIVKHLMKVELPLGIKIEISDGSYNTLNTKEEIADILAKHLIGKHWPLYGDSKEEEQTFIKKAIKRGILPEGTKSLLN